MTTIHTQRWETLDDAQFLYIVAMYRRFKDVNELTHKINVDYIKKRCLRMGYSFELGCCGKNIIKELK